MLVAWLSLDLVVKKVQRHAKKEKITANLADFQASDKKWKLVEVIDFKLKAEDS